ncbi:MAG: energy transducer TonB, partial [Candidatus Baltobacteraceae bacterium]
EVAPLGGEDAIVPRPPAIAYDKHAQGTAAIAVSVDAQGTPLRCAVTQSSGYAVLDASVCRAAMQARYSPRRVDGRSVAGVYRDAFTFRSSDGQ